MLIIFEKGSILDVCYGFYYKHLQFLKKWVLNIDYKSKSNSVTKGWTLL